MSKEEILKQLDSLDINRENITILSSGALTIRGILTSARDIDIAITKDEFDKINKKYKLLHLSDNWYRLNSKIEFMVDGFTGKREKVGKYYLHEINDYYEYIKSNLNEKNKKRIPLVEKYLKSKLI